jgi:hypothetical protein
VCHPPEGRGGGTGVGRWDRVLGASRMAGMRLVSVVVLLLGAVCGGADRGFPTDGEGVRALVLAGVDRDFRHTVPLPNGFERCFRSAFARELTTPRLRRLRATHANRGEPASARALNALGVAVAGSCGGRQWVPELTSAAQGLR